MVAEKNIFKLKTIKANVCPGGNAHWWRNIDLHELIGPQYHMYKRFRIRVCEIRYPNGTDPKRRSWT